MNKLKNIIIAVLAATCIIQAFNLHSAHHELKQQKEFSTDTENFMKSYHHYTMEGLKEKYEGMQKTNTVLTNR